MLVTDSCAYVPPSDTPPARRKILERLHEFHASPQDCIDIAATANVSKVVLTHHLPEVQPVFDSSHYSGEGIVGNDLDIITI